MWYDDCVQTCHFRSKWEGALLPEILLENLATQYRCFISDLPELAQSKAFLESLARFDFRTYSLKECSYALSYLFETTLIFIDYSSIADYIHQQLKKLKKGPKGEGVSPSI